MENNNEVENGSRRDLLKTAATVAGVASVAALNASEAEAAPAPAKAKIPTPKANTNTLTAGKYPKGTVIAPARVKGANDRIVVGFIGLGGQGTNGHLNRFVKTGTERNTQVIAACDVYQPNMDRAVGMIKNAATTGGSETVLADRDYRKIIENKDIDAVMIATPEHWHGQIAVHAMQAGKHVYNEKPMVRYLDEAFQVHDVAMATKCVFQVGSQGCSDVRWHAAAKAIREGKLGKLVMGQGSYCRNNRKGEWNYGIPGGMTAENMDWEGWLGSAPTRSWDYKGGAGGDQQPERDDAGARWARYRKYWDYSAGILGDLMPHKLHPFLIASGNPEYPTRVISIGTHSIQNKDREVADTVQVMAEFPSGWTMLFIGSTVNEQGLPDLFRGEKGSVYFGNEVKIQPERPWSDEVEEEVVDKNAPDLKKYHGWEDVFAHETNWLDSIRRNDPMYCNANIDLATKVQTIISLAEMSQRKNKAMLFDAKTRKVTAG
jgi:predicted dehydrogenase